MEGERERKRVSERACGGREGERKRE